MWAIAQEENWNKQKHNQEKRKLEQMQKPTSVQLDEKVDELVTEKMDSTVPKEVRNILAGSIKHNAFKASRFPKKYSKKAHNNETQHGGEHGFKGKRRKNKNASASTNTSSVITGGAENTTEEKSAENAPITITFPVLQHCPIFGAEKLEQWLCNTYNPPMLSPSNGCIHTSIRHCFFPLF